MIAGDFSLGRRSQLSHWEIARALLIGVGFLLVFAIVFGFRNDEVPTLVAGQVSRQTILAPERVTFASQFETLEARARAEAAIPDSYDPPNAELAREQVRIAGRFFERMDTVRHDPLLTADQKIAWLRSVPTVTLPSLVLSRTMTIDEPIYHRIVSETLYVLDVTMRDEIRSNSLDVEFARIPSRVSLALSADQADLVTQWTKTFVIPNSSFNAQRTGELRRQARERVGTVYRTVENGEAVIRGGEVVTPQAIEALEALGISNPRAELGDYAGPVLLAALFTVLLSVYLIRLRPGLLSHWRVLTLLAFLIVLAAIGGKLAASDRTILVYLYPLSAAVMLVAVLVDSVVALGAAIILALAMGIVAHNSLEITVYALAGGVIAAMSLGRIERLPAFLWAGVYVALANAAVIAIYRVAMPDSQSTATTQQLVAGLGNGALAGLIAIGSLFVLGKWFGITTSLELIDLERPTHPLLQRLLSDAPGTYHHSLIVGQLAEHAAQRIGADPLLVRVAAYYHDVGKIAEPQMFIENQLGGSNVHDQLQPQESAKIVIDHIQRGLQLARQHRLPRRLLDFIPQHHGTTTAAYFHHKAKQAHPSEILDEATFRYPGPKPQSREAGILMLADGVEAVTRAEHPSTPEGILGLVDRIINERMRDGQLDDSELTLRDIQDTRAAFFDVLQGLYHTRVKYPEPSALPASELKALPKTTNAGRDKHTR